MNEYYQETGTPLPPVTRVEAHDIPEPYRSLLVHEKEMTPTLESAYHRMDLRVLKYALRGAVVSRQVVLVLEGTEMAVAFCAIKIYLEHFPPEAKRLVLERKRPLGTILNSERVPHSSHPRAYIQVAADETINRALDLTHSGVLYGRRNKLIDSSQHTLAQVVEILPPAHAAPADARKDRREKLMTLSYQRQ